MKISPIAQGGAPGTALGSIDIGRTADPVKMEKARAIARGEKVPEAQSDPQVERIQNVRKIKMHTQRSPEVLPPAEALEEPSPEAAPEPVSSTPDTGEATVEATQPLSPQFAALAKQKRAFQLEKAAFEKEKAEFSSRNQDGSGEILSRLKSQPLSVLQEQGILDNPEFYNSLTERIMDPSQGIRTEVQSTIQALREEIKALKEGVDKNFQTREEQQEQAALTEMSYEAESLAKEGDAYELIRSEGDAGIERVLRLIHSTYKKTGRVLGVKEAMDHVESEYLSKAEKLAQLKKVQGKLQPSAPPLQPQQRQMRTLTARDSVSAPMTAKQRAIAAFQGNLKR